MWSVLLSTQSYGVEYKTTQLTNDSFNDADFKLNNGQIIWCKSDGNDSEIWFYDGNQAASLTNNTYDDIQPDLYNGIKVWARKDEYMKEFPPGSGSEQPWVDLYVYLNTDGNQISFSSCSKNGFEGYTTGGPLLAPKIHNDEIAWYESYQDETIFEIRLCLYDVSTGVKDYLAVPGTGAFRGSKIYNGQVAWSAYTGAGGYWQPYWPTYDIFFYNGSGLSSLSNIERVTTDAPIQNTNENVQLSNGQMVWQAYYSGGSRDIFYYNSASSERRKVSVNPNDDCNPQIDGDWIVWQGYDGYDYEIFLYNIKIRKITQISRDSEDDWYPQIHNGQVVWEGYDDTDGDYEIFLYDIETKKKIQITNNTYEDFNPQIHNGKIVWQAIPEGSDTEIFLAEPEFYIYNVGDGESIRLEWPVYKEAGTIICYQIHRKPETGSTWEMVNNKTVYNPGQEDKNKNMVVYVDYPQNALASPGPPERGIVYDYKVEVYREIRVKGEEVENDPENDEYVPGFDYDGKKGVSEPFVMLVRGYGGDAPPYWQQYPVFLERKDFKPIPDVVNGRDIPKTIWDPAKLEHMNVLYPGAVAGDTTEKIGALDAYLCAEKILEELKLWLSEVKQCNERYNPGDPQSRIVLDWVPDHFYIICHSMGGPFSRAIEHRIDFYLNSEWQEKSTRDTYVPYVKKIAMISPGNMGSSLANLLRSIPWPVHFAVERVSEKEQEWTCTTFAMARNTAKFNWVMPPKKDAEYYLLGGNYWYSQDGGLKETIGYFLNYWYLLSKESDSFFSPLEEHKNDGVLTYYLQKGKMTDKVWNRLKKYPYFQGETDRTKFEFNPVYTAVNGPLSLNHSSGVILDTSETVRNKIWEMIDIPPRS